MIQLKTHAMNKMIPPFNPESEEIEADVARILAEAPVKNLTEQEVLQTLRLIQLQTLLTDKNRISRFSVTVYQDDQRLMTCSEDDRFMALLLDADVRQIVLTTRRCIYCFGHKPQYWYKIARRSSIVYTKSLMLEGTCGGRYFGKGWVIAPHILTLRRWIVENGTNQELSTNKEG